MKVNPEYYCAFCDEVLLYDEVYRKNDDLHCIKCGYPADYIPDPADQSGLYDTLEEKYL